MRPRSSTRGALSTRAAIISPRNIEDLVGKSREIASRQPRESPKRFSLAFLILGKHVRLRGEKGEMGRGRGRGGEERILCRSLGTFSYR